MQTPPKPEKELLEQVSDAIRAVQELLGHKASP
ncbi:MAG: hypothetical protein HFACDABA_03132 [Anaerolineales bacterium]|nr:hypothetical protein [Anaerolineales bacterium]